ncbi:Peptidase_S8 domain-containing protein [Gammaproteobacteria bacterium]
MKKTLFFTSLLVMQVASAAEVVRVHAPAVAGKGFVPGQWIVGFSLPKRTSSPELAQAVQSLGGKIQDVLPDQSAALLDFGSERMAIEAEKSLRSRGDLSYVERNGYIQLEPEPVPPFLRAMEKQGRKLPAKNPQKPLGGSSGGGGGSTATDPASGLQWHLTVIRKNAPDFVVSSGLSPTVAVIDTGVDYTHPDLQANLLPGYNVVAKNTDPFDDAGHGTHVTGIIAAVAGNSLYGEGICPSCKVVPVKVLDGSGSGTDFGVAYGMAWVVSHRDQYFPAIKVVNMSLGGGYNSAIAAQTLAMKNAGLVLVAAGGNDNTSDKTAAYPGSDPNVALRVMATEQTDCRTFFSNFSPSSSPTQYNIAAPGWNVWSTLPGFGYGPESGTSMASPVVAGAAALVWGQFPNLTRDQLVSKLISSGKRISCGFAAVTSRLDVRKAILGSPETTIIGRVLDPWTALPPSPTSPNNTPTVVELLQGSTVQTSDETDFSGFYELDNLAASPQVLRASRTKYVTAQFRSTSVDAGVVNGPYVDALPHARLKGDISISLNWKNFQPSTWSSCPKYCYGWWLELTVKLPNRKYISDYQGSAVDTGDLTTDPYVMSGVSPGYTMEPVSSIVIAAQASDGEYPVFVDNYPSLGSFNGSWDNSAAVVRIFNGKTLKATLMVPANCGKNEYWQVGKLVKSGTSYTWTAVDPVKSCTNILP